MKKTIFANWGHAKQGKSGTVKKIAQIILAKYPNAETYPLIIDYSFDIKIVITIGDIKIGIESQGDPNSRLPASLKEFKSISCDIIICSTRTSGATVLAVEKLKEIPYNYDIIWFTNYRSSEKNSDLINSKSAEDVFKLIQDVIENKL
jgi:hypothetical protein